MSTENKSCVGFIGGGNMATAIGEGIIKMKICDPSVVWVSGPHLENLSHWAELGANITTNNETVVDMCDVIFICVKPHLLGVALYNMKHKPGAHKLFVSVLAGVNIKVIESHCRFVEHPRVIRVMPNTPLLVGKGASVYTLGHAATEDDATFIEKILGSCGIVKRVPEEMIHAAGALSGSGPAFVYLMIEAMSDGGVKQGLPRAMATRFAAQTVLGAAQMVLDTGRHPGQLKDEVCSPGGSTICGIHELEKGGVRASYMKAVEAAVARTKHMEIESNMRNN